MGNWQDFFLFFFERETCFGIPFHFDYGHRPRLLVCEPD